MEHSPWIAIALVAGGACKNADDDKIEGERAPVAAAKRACESAELR